MPQYYAFDVTASPQKVENLLAECIVDGFLGFSETETDGKIKINICYDDKDCALNVQKLLLQNYSVSRVEEIENRDWNEEWKKTISPVKITEKIWVSPKWLEPKMQNGECWIKIEPKMAFGTGHHETTRIAAKLIEETAGAKTLLDIGTGSGVLAFAAQIADYKSITGLEIDKDCEENLAQNFEDNKENSDIRFIIGGLEKVNMSAKFDTVVMNMISSQSMPLLNDICKILHKDGFLLWSGILFEEREKIVEEAKKFGFELQKEIVENEWWGAKFLKT
ncbi:MAG: 50S ribosomal protein L11 methyltransferase [Chitinispirillales bacterium]|jgi:ribosomal protein L11 methyltransferase|nr:50S ribosomal protein L11 methyltransferase [Chitinispirillales bacterium]